MRDGEGMPCWFATETEAQREIAEHMVMRLRQFIDGERDFYDAIRIEEYVIPVNVLTDGSVIDKDGRHFGKSD